MFRRSVFNCYPGPDFTAFPWLLLMNTLLPCVCRSSPRRRAEPERKLSIDTCSLRESFFPATVVEHKCRKCSAQQAQHRDCQSYFQKWGSENQSHCAFTLWNLNCSNCIVGLQDTFRGFVVIYVCFPAWVKTVCGN